jgi:2-iminobutanoate/2-iminopropanoate deaminase
MKNSIQKIETDKAPKAIGPYSQATLADGFMFISGQIPINPETGKIESLDITSQTNQVLDNIEEILKAAGLTFEDVVKTEIYVSDLENFTLINSLYGKRFSHLIKPARQLMQVSRLPLDSLIEISCIAKK